MAEQLRIPTCPGCSEYKNNLADTPYKCKECHRTIPQTVLGGSPPWSVENITTDPLSPPRVIPTPPFSNTTLHDQLIKILFEPRPHTNPYAICSSVPTTPSNYSDESPQLTPSSISLASLDLLPRGSIRDPHPLLESTPIYMNIAIPTAIIRSLETSSASSSSSSTSSAPSFFPAQRPLAEIYQPPRRRRIVRACLRICGCNGAEGEEEE